MLMKKSVFDLRYFKYSMRRMLPYSLIMALILLFSSFIMFNFVNKTIYGASPIPFFEPYEVGMTANFGMYVIPIVLAVGLFGFSHKRNASDFLLGAPIRRSSVFITNFVIAGIIIFVTLLLNMLFIAFTVNVARASSDMIIAFGAYVNAFLYNFIGYMLVFAASALAATVTGTALAQILVTFVIIFLPTFLVCFAQLGMQAGGQLVSETAYSAYHVTYMGDLANIFILPNIAAGPVSMAYTSIVNSSVGGFYGSVSFFMTAQSLCYTLLISIIYGSIGLVLFNKYKAENAGRPFVSKGINIAALAGMFVPILLIVFFSFFESVGYEAMLGEMVFYIALLLMLVAYIVINLILNKGFSDFGKMLVVFAVIVVITLPLATVPEVIVGKNKEISLATGNIKEISVYIRPINLTPTNNEGIKNTYKKVTVNDPKILAELDSSSVEGASSVFFYELTDANGKTVTLRSQLPDSFITALYDYIDSDIEVKKSLFSHEGGNNAVGAALFVKTTAYGKNTITPYGDKDEVKRIICEKELELLETPISEIYSSNNRYVETYYGMETVDPGFIESGSVSFSLPVLRFADGRYYMSYYELDYDSELYSQLSSDIQARAKHLITNIAPHDGISAYLGGALEIGDEQYLGLGEIVKELPQVLRDDFINMLLSAADKPVTAEGTVGIYISSSVATRLIFVNIDRDIAPLLEKYAELVVKADGNDHELGYIANIYLLKGEATANSGSFPKTDSVVAEIKNKAETIKKLILTKYTRENVPDELHFVKMTVSPYPDETDNVFFPIDESFTETLKKVNEAFSSVDKYYLDPANVVSVTSDYNGFELTDKEDIEYLASLVKFHYFNFFFSKTNSDSFYYGKPDYESYYFTFSFANGEKVSYELPLTARISEIIEHEEGGYHVQY